MFIRKPLYLMAEGDGAGDGAGAGGEGGSGEGGAAGAAAGGDNGGKPAEEGKTFTQADVERIIAGRLQKYADYDDLKAKLAEVEDANASETEKAIKAAKEEGRQAALSEAGPLLVAAEFRAALAGRRTREEVAELIEDYDLTKYLTETGEVDVKRVAEKADLLVPPQEERKPAPSFGGGARKTKADSSDVKPGVGRIRAAYANTK